MISLNKWEIFILGYFLGTFAGVMFLIILNTLIQYKKTRKIYDNFKNKTDQFSNSFKPRTGDGQRD